MKWSLGSTALLLALAAGTNAMAAEPADPAFGTPVARPGIWSSNLGNGFLGGNHVRPVSMGHGGHGNGEIVAGEGYGAAAVEGGYAYGPGSCDDRPPCVDHLWDGYVKRPLRCNHGHRHGCGAGGCGAGWSYNGLGAGCPGCGLKLKSWFGGSCGGDCTDDCGAASACDSGSCDAGCGLFAKHHSRSACGSCGGGGLGHGFKHGGLGRFWASCFGNSCGCGDAAGSCGCADSVAGEASAAVVPGPVGPAKPIERGFTPTPAQPPHGVKGPALELDEAPLPPAPMPESEKTEDTQPMETKEATKEAAKRSFPSLRGFGSFGL